MAMCSYPSVCNRKPYKSLDIFVGEAPDPERDYPRVRDGLHVHIEGLETYDQVKEMTGYVWMLASGQMKTIPTAALSEQMREQCDGYFPGYSKGKKE